MNKPTRPITEEEKQKRPMPGEVAPKDAALKARQFAALERAKWRRR